MHHCQNYNFHCRDNNRCSVAATNAESCSPVAALEKSCMIKVFQTFTSNANTNSNTNSSAALEESCMIKVFPIFISNTNSQMQTQMQKQIQIQIQTFTFNTNTNTNNPSNWPELTDSYSSI